MYATYTSFNVWIMSIFVIDTHIVKGKWLLSIKGWCLEVPCHFQLTACLSQQVFHFHRGSRLKNILIGFHCLEAPLQTFWPESPLRSAGSNRTLLYPSWLTGLKLASNWKPIVCPKDHLNPGWKYKILYNCF